MGCLSSRSTIAPSDRIESDPNQRNEISTSRVDEESGSSLNNNLKFRKQQNGSVVWRNQNSGAASSSQNVGTDGRESTNSSVGGVGEDVMSILMKDATKSNEIETDEMGRQGNGSCANRSTPSRGNDDIEGKVTDDIEAQTDSKRPATGSLSSEVPDIDLLRQYVVVDYEISQLEDRDALRLYHEKIEQLELLERELDMIGSEVEKATVRSGSDAQADSPSSVNRPQINPKMDVESNSVCSGASGSFSRKSWGTYETQPANEKEKKPSIGLSKKASSAVVENRSRQFDEQAYAKIEKVFNRKIILEKERDRLKKEVEMVIVECDKLQQRYKTRDEILDKLFDGRTGNGLENHLEQQLNWLLEQKHYVDQVFYAWKRAETLTSQTCEQFASALEILNRLPGIDDAEQRDLLTKSIRDLLVKSRQDMEQAQKYNPNVDAPFFTDNETERFDKIIESVSSNSIGPSEHSQIVTVIQFAYKRAVSIRIWLEQILQTTIARDSFELAEEYKWIAIQLRKERINLIRSKLQDSPYRSMALSVQKQLAQQQSLIDRQQRELNRDSGVESEPNDMDIEDEIYRLLELNKSRLEAKAAPRGGSRREPNLSNRDAIQSAKNLAEQRLKVGQDMIVSSSSSSESNRDQIIRERIQRRTIGKENVGGQAAPQVPSPSKVNHDEDNDDDDVDDDADDAEEDDKNEQREKINARYSVLSGYSTTRAIPTPTKLRIELDEEARQRLLKQVDQIHNRHKSRIERLRGSNRAKASSFIMDRMQQVRANQQQISGSVADNPTAGSL